MKPKTHFDNDRPMRRDTVVDRICQYPQDTETIIQEHLLGIAIRIHNQVGHRYNAARQFGLADIIRDTARMADALKYHSGEME